MQPYLPSLFAAPSFEGMIELAARLSICGMLIGCFVEHDVPTLTLAVALTDLPIYAAIMPLHHRKAAVLCHGSCGTISTHLSGHGYTHFDTFLCILGPTFSRRLVER